MIAYDLKYNVSSCFSFRTCGSDSGTSAEVERDEWCKVSVFSVVMYYNCSPCFLISQLFLTESFSLIFELCFCVL